MLNRIPFALFLLVAIASLGQGAYASGSSDVVIPEMQGISVVGHADIIAKPDIAYLTIGVMTQDKEQTAAVSVNATNTRTVIDSLHSSGVPDKDIQTENYNVQPQYDYHSSPPVLTGYQVTNSLRVSVHDLTKAGQITDNAVTAGANQVGGISFDIADKLAVQVQALAMAIYHARMKAQVAAKAAGVGLGRMLNLSEGTTPAVQPIYFGGSNAKAAMADAAAVTPFESNQIHITADVTMLFAVDYSSH